MNIQLPPPERCPNIWPMFVTWIATKMAMDSMISRDDSELPIMDVQFRGRSMSHCPFCGVTLKPWRDFAIAYRHPEVEVR